MKRTTTTITMKFRPSVKSFSFHTSSSLNLSRNIPFTSEFRRFQIVASKRSVRESFVTQTEVTSQHRRSELPAAARAIEKRAEAVGDRGGHRR